MHVTQNSLMNCFVTLIEKENETFKKKYSSYKFFCNPNIQQLGKQCLENKSQCKKTD